MTATASPQWRFPSSQHWIIEESVALRLAVQVLVSVGIVATDVAAESWNSVWAVPLGLVGAWWSWRGRYQRTWILKALLALAMLLVLGIFFQRLFSNLNDTRLVLADLLVQLQVIHSFDLPRRQDLGYSMVIGLVLLGVAGTLSQTLAFGPVLLVFFGVGLVTLVLEYRSRLGFSRLNPQQQQRFWQRRGRNLVSLGMAVVGLGLVLFMVFPRFPAFQLTTFPVSGGMQLPEALEESTILNPGLTNSGLEKSATLSDEALTQQLQAAVEGSGEVNLTLDNYFGFSSQLDLRLVGRVSIRPRTVLRVRSQAPAFWWVSSFDQYTGSAWNRTRLEDARVLERNPLSNRVNVASPDALTRLRTRTVVQTYTVVTPIPSLIPAVAAPSFLFFPSGKLVQDVDGGLRASAPLPDGLTYTVVSRVPFRDRTALQEAELRIPPEIASLYLQLPPDLDPRIAALARAQVVGIDSPYDQALHLGQYLKQNYTLQARQPIQASQEVASRFLFELQGGSPEEFSTTLVVMLRLLGIPARLAVGYNVGRFNPFTGYYVVSSQDAITLAEVGIPGYGWFGINPIPGYELLPPHLTETEPFSALKAFWQWFAGLLPPPVVEWIGMLLSGALALVAWGIRSVQRWVQDLGWQTGVVWLVLATVGVGMGAFVSWLGWWWRWQRRLQRLQGIERLYVLLLRKLASQMPKGAAQTPAEYQQTLERRLSGTDSAPIQGILTAYQDWHYGGIEPDPQDLARWQQWLRQFQPRWVSNTDETVVSS
jgi:transglutaminase-like putative cysteine protease